jgi:hypothetical protein
MGICPTGKRCRALFAPVSARIWWSMIFSENRCTLFGIML